MKFVKRKLMAVVKTMTILCCALGIAYQFQEIHNILIPASAEANFAFRYDAPKQKIIEALDRLEAPAGRVAKLADAVLKAAGDTGVDPLMLVALMYTESSFNPKAISHKGYKGLMQTPVMTGWYDLDVIMGARILKEKLSIADGNMKLALALYKGGDNPKAHMYAAKVLELWSRLKSD